MNNKLSKLHPYPFEKLRILLNPVEKIKNIKLHQIDLSIGEPKHATPDCVKLAIKKNLEGISVYPATKGSNKFRETVSQWIAKRYNIIAPDPNNDILPVLGSKEALFSLTQTIIDSNNKNPLVICPNPCYQIYEGAAILAGADVYYTSINENNKFAYNLDEIPSNILKNTQLLFVCSPGNPTGNVIDLDTWKKIFNLSEKYGFVIASDECYSEIYLDEKKPTLGALQAASLLNKDHNKLIVLSSLSKRSNVPGLRSGFVVGDRKIINDFLLYRTYHGSAMSKLISEASIAAWSDEQHVIENRILYRKKFSEVIPILNKAIDINKPEASFYLWIKTPISDEIFAKELYKQYNVKVIPGSFLSRDFNGINPGKNYIRIALVDTIEDCVEAANRMVSFINSIS
ncbi:LL-diaminopimelate aminotransferase [Candidatus Kinetoplastibacterium sorsogonicusi]|uniref:LL-diaminopimelate aminotransferase n=1 Tax=Candidatus Kinetoplastidibacterium kentomonadis TaxID=1576550 RepID=A0A3Q8ETK1_9PROT|nr:succinyldiaminopimelate transaminase [Candidatus Kinetoplastibacterium sorsogonicusi]AWD32352.1 LL-diaminopimelate aminotransferase [Candidatus Kinetoplastibacterium sorsogonicusi]